MLEKHMANGLIYKANTVNKHFARIQQIESTYTGLSLADCSAIALCEHLCTDLKRQSIVLTGDKRMRTALKQMELSCHGILWVLYELQNTGNYDAGYLCKALKVLTNMNKRLPQKHIKMLEAHLCLKNK